MSTGISWTDETWNMWPGCVPSSSGCAHCWARHPAWRMAYNPNPKVAAPYLGIVKKVLEDGTEILGGEDHPRRKETGELKFTGLTRFVPERLEIPLRWKKPRRIFVSANSDLFLPSRVATEEARRQLAAMFGVMAACPQHTFQVLTKWPGNAREWFAWLIRDGIADVVMQSNADAATGRMLDIEVTNVWPLSNVIFGVSVEDQRAADERLPIMAELKRNGLVSKVFVSYEPALGPVDFSPWLDDTIDWLICGGESGARARPMHPDWARAARDQALASRTPFLFKQWGSWRPVAEDDCGWTHIVAPSGRVTARGQEAPVSDWVSCAYMRRASKKVAGSVLDGRRWLEFPS